MPSSKNPFLRYRIINACLTNPKKPYPTLEEIKTALAREDIVVEIRAIEGDLEAMRYDKQLGYNAPIAYSRKHRGYQYTDPTYSTEKLPLTREELEAFRFTVESLGRFKGAEVLQQVQGIFGKLDKVMTQQLNARPHAQDAPVVAFEEVPYSHGIEHFDRLYKAITKQQPLNIRYKRFDTDTASDHLFHPYLLKEYKFRWYLLGYSEKRKGRLVLALDRIEAIQTTRAPFIPNKGIDLRKYFDHTLGVTIKETQVREIKLWFSVNQGHYIKTQSLHGTQKIINDTKDSLIITLQLIPNYELLQTLLAFGPEVKVLAPEGLQVQLKEMLARSMALYG